MSYGAYNTAVYNRFAFDASWSAALEFARAADSVVTQAAEAFTAASTNAVAVASAVTQTAQAFTAAGTNAVAAASDSIGGAHTLTSVFFPRVLEHVRGSVLSPHIINQLLVQHARGGRVTVH